MSDPVEIMADQLPGAHRPARLINAADALAALVEDGWSIVRVAGQLWEDLDDDPESPTYGTTLRSAVITEEWTP